MALAEVVDRDRVRMSQRGGRTCFTEEPVDRVWSIPVGADDLERDLPPAVGVDGTVDLAHAASADERLERVPLDRPDADGRGAEGPAPPDSAAAWHPTWLPSLPVEPSR